MTELYPHFCQQLHPYSSRCFVLALSGGADSRVMLELLARYRDEFGVSVCAVHVHHGLSKNADHWAMCCQTWCDESFVPLSVEHVHLDIKSGESIEKLARDARYAVLAKHIKDNDVLLLGQHADDQIETFLLALKRGSGPKGLSSMALSAPFSNGILLRPLLTVKRADIEDFAESNQLSWVTDESNEDVRYERNFIRHQITPILSDRWPSIHQAVQRSAELCAEQQALLEELLREELKHTLYSDGSLKIDVLDEKSDGVRRQIIRQWLTTHKMTMPSRKHTEMIWLEVASSTVDANPKLKLGDREIRRFDNRLYCVDEYRDISAWKSSIVVEQKLLLPDELGTLSIVTQQGGIGLPERLDDLWVSFNPEGLSACPVGRAGSRKLKKLFQEYGVPSWLRRRIPILMYQDKVVAVANLFVDRDFSGQDCMLVWDKSSLSCQNCP
ncbi:tRNA lysidine(34) synthetase TilS [Vibrio ziniensis]|uniref:tRNA(Ile)-lysidine synthase n=1 Tax=Vibrio ziniensis TaxID=2711221 RepID=A0A6G7CKA9_9VIBR|nr:tRNA lysidine(34) synthetase TilS [Vibrio ziniensis]QIH42510.1 tRNA lysidine(34) synthetase TilS [Vibrio ziniensis]